MTDRDPLHPDLVQISAGARHLEREAILAIVRAIKAEGRPSGSPYSTGVYDAATRIEEAIKERE